MTLNVSRASRVLAGRAIKKVVSKELRIIDEFAGRMKIWVLRTIAKTILCVR
jgi:hypothetical protein